MEVQPIADSPCIGFRVEIHDKNSHLYNQLYARGSFLPLDAEAPVVPGAFYEYIVGGRVTPFVSFFATWRAALDKFEHCISRGCTNVIVFAVWLVGLGPIYDSYEAARFLVQHHGYTLRPGFLGPSTSELLIPAPIRAQDNRLLAVFEPAGPPGSVERLSLTVPLFFPQAPTSADNRNWHVQRPEWRSKTHLECKVLIPEGFIPHPYTHITPDVTYELHQKVYAQLGREDSYKCHSLVLALIGQRHTRDAEGNLVIPLPDQRQDPLENTIEQEQD